MKNAIIGLIVALLLCLLPMPYGFYIIVRLYVTVVFGILAINKYEESKRVIAVLYGVVALLFQPFAMITMERETWNIIDILLVVVLIVTLITRKD